jgi:hypothetical protein
MSSVGVVPRSVVVVPEHDVEVEKEAPTDGSAKPVDPDPVVAAQREVGQRLCQFIFFERLIFWSEKSEECHYVNQIELEHKLRMEN